MPGLDKKACKARGLRFSKRKCGGCYNRCKRYRKEYYAPALNKCVSKVKKAAVVAAVSKAVKKIDPLKPAIDTRNIALKTLCATQGRLWNAVLGRCSTNCSNPQNIFDATKKACVPKKAAIVKKVIQARKNGWCPKGSYWSKSKGICKVISQRRCRKFRRVWTTFCTEVCQEPLKRYIRGKRGRCYRRRNTVKKVLKAAAAVTTPPRFTRAIDEDEPTLLGTSRANSPNDPILVDAARRFEAIE